MVATRKFYHEIEKQLLEEGFKKENILILGELLNSMFRAMYFDLPELWRQKDEVFVDVGGYDGFTSLRFCEWAQGDYKKIYIFEPIPALNKRCKENLRNVPNCEVIKKDCGILRHNCNFCQMNLIRRLL